MDDDLLERLIRARPEGWRRRAAALGGRQLVHDGLVTTLTGIPAPWLNPTSVVADPADPSVALAAAEVDRPPETGGFGIDLVVDRFPAVLAAAETTGLVRRTSQPLMVLAPASLPSAPPPEGIVLARAEDRLAEVAVVDAEVFEDPVEISAAFLDPRVFRDPAFRAYAALRDGRAVATTVTTIVDGVLSVNGVGVVAAERRRGIGAAITAFAVRDRADEAEIAFLEAHGDAARVYARLGFRPIATWEVWVRPDQSEEAVREGGPPPRGGV
ncbi:MAG TPA: GNAT family N-acetyltransferase [Actinomycetota bacterium]